MNREKLMATVLDWENNARICETSLTDETLHMSFREQIERRAEVWRHCAQSIRKLAKEAE